MDSRGRCRHQHLFLQTGEDSYKVMQTSKIFLPFLQKKCKVSGNQIVSTCHENVVCSSGDISLRNLAPCTQKEAGTHLLLHAADCVRQEHSIISIRTSDTDVVVQAISLSQQLGVKEYGHHLKQENISGILLSMALPPSLDLTRAKHCLSSMPSQGVILFLSLQEGANSKHGKHGWLFLL